MVTRDQKASQSIQDYIEDRLRDNGYTENLLEMIDAYPDEATLEGPIGKNYVALMFNFDDGGNAAECGSDLTRYEYVIEGFIFGRSTANAENIATTVKALLNMERRVPLKDYAVPDKPIIDYMPLVTVSAMRQIVNEPRNWERNLWTVTVRLEDEFYASAGDDA